MRRLILHRSLSSPSRRLFSSSSRFLTVSLAYSRHDPPPNSPSHPPIIVMHGLFGSQRNNRTMSKVLAQSLSRPVYLLDLRNHGDSPHHATHTYTAMAEDVESFLSSHSISNPILLGHSMGAKVAMTLALRQPHNYSALIPVDNAPVDAALKSDFSAYVQAMREIDEHRPRITRQRDADKILQKYESDMGIRQFLLTNLVKAPVLSSSAAERSSGQKTTPHTSELKFRIPLHTLAKSLPDMADFPFKDPEEVRYEGPTLVVRGTRSHYVSDDTLPVVGRFFPKFEVLDVDAGHWVMSERFEEFKDGVVEWVRRVVDGDKS